MLFLMVWHRAIKWCHLENYSLGNKCFSLLTDLNHLKIDGLSYNFYICQGSPSFHLVTVQEMYPVTRHTDLPRESPRIFFFSNCTKFSEMKPESNSSKVENPFGVTPSKDFREYLSSTNLGGIRKEASRTKLLFSSSF